MRLTSSVRPPMVEVVTNTCGLKTRRINFDIQEVRHTNAEDANAGTDDVIFDYASATLSPHQWTRGCIIDAVIRSRYTADHMEAIINNYLLDSGDVEATNEFCEMQDWRKQAKRIADEVLAAGK